ncbi:MAG: cytochrome P450 [Acidobacteriota bacterium]|nr:cytochrome P450 [Acidobacteriota bacterium]
MKGSSKRPPGPAGRFLVGVLPMRRQDPLALLTGWARRYGDIFHYRAFGVPVYVLSHPDYIETVLVRCPQDFVKGRGLQVNKSLFGKGLLTSEGAQWLAQRRLCQPPLRGERIEGYGPLMTDCAARMLKDWRDGEVRDLQAEMTKLTLEIVARALFGVEMTDLASEVAGALRPLMEFNTRGRILLPALRYMPTPASIRYRLAVRRLDRVVEEILMRARRAGENSGGLLAALIRANLDHPSEMPPSLLRDEVMTFLLAGHETTALTLTWAFYLLALHPDAERSLVLELGRVLGERAPSTQDLPMLLQTKRVLKETLRLFPPAYAVVRAAGRNTEIGDYNIPKGASIILSQWIVHRDPRFFPDPECFNPGRWTPERESELPRFAYFPFGGGPRGCLGSHFALTEAALILASVMQKFHLDLESREPLIPIPAITLRPNRNLRVVVRRREPPDRTTALAPD